ncbi:Glycosyltransferase, catalytic subunit of cellulose synthase and poly-beta-1,6-N-acetylglucosamine synthase [Chryseobacterium taichungense]|uniref:Glycosyltransferase, catalytic subunit of cellulose synthase and poly-beta-1,6-N-acetylglucosamine synthase n=1 Tax=Chryseobacterium taichungense TaxID=295069 RepID=A0A1H7XHZ3_9FLAO|nr:glycosyltransferase [Chryseobacterium taichungense]SEM33285.1 Glycosyltransferase, catalytic subunit of cellulose synthase and poly-beta-1,6-N-acetylglucosamine synthase [Chryseobacterium taichungense]
MENFWEIIYSNLKYSDWSTILNWGWYVFIIDIPRFLILEIIVLFVTFRKRFINEDKWKLAHGKLMREFPLVTVLVPGHNEGKHLHKMVVSMQKQTYKNIEIIVVDDGSTDHTGIIGRSFEKKGFITKFLRSEIRGGKASAANLGLKYSKGKFVVHIDADSSLDNNAIEKALLPFYVRKNIGGVGGNLMVRNDEDSLTSTMQYLEYQQSISISRIVLSSLGIYKIISGAFGVFPRKVLERVGGWDVGPGLDGDLTVKIRKIGYQIHFEQTAVCNTHVPVKWGKLAKQRLRWSRSLVRFRLRKHYDIWIPNKNFRWSNFFSFFENVFFGLVLDITWLIYMLRIIIENPEFLLFWLPFKYLVYLLLYFTQFLICLLIVKNKKKYLSKIIYVPLYPLYMGYFMRIVRTIAYFDELFFYDSYKDPWNPQKTSKKAREFGA